MEPLTPAELYDRSQNSYHPCLRHGDLMLVPKLGKVPHRCVLCNAPATNIKEHRYTWRRTYSYLVLALILLVPLVMILVHKWAGALMIGAIAWYAEATTHRIVLSYGVCAEHTSKRDMAMWLGIGCIVQVLVLAFLWAEGYIGALALPISLFICGALVLLLRGTRSPLTVKFADARETRMAGCGDAFLASLEQR